VGIVAPWRNTLDKSKQKTDQRRWCTTTRLWRWNRQCSDTLPYKIQTPGNYQEENIQQANISFVMSIRHSVSLQGKTLLALERFSWNFIFETFSKVCGQKFKFCENPTRSTGTLYEDLRTYMISRWTLLTIRNVPDKICRENQNSQFMFHNFFPKMVPLVRWCEKCGRATQSTGDNIWRGKDAICMPGN